MRGTAVLLGGFAFFVFFLVVVVSVGTAELEEEEGEEGLMEMHFSWTSKVEYIEALRLVKTCWYRRIHRRQDE